MRGIEANDERDIARTVLQVLGIVAMMVACAWILRPFLLAGLWATTIVVATWPLLLRLEGLLGGRRAPAVAVMSIALLVILIGPLSVGIAGLVDNADRIAGWLKSMTSFSVPPPPQWLESLPIVGARATARWQNLASSTPEEIGARVAPYARSVLEWFLVQVGSLGFMVVQFLLTVAIAAVLYVNGETAARGVRRFAA